MHILLKTKIPFFSPFDRFLGPSCCKDYFLEKFSLSLSLIILFTNVQNKKYIYTYIKVQ